MVGMTPRCSGPDSGSRAAWASVHQILGALQETARTLGHAAAQRRRHDRSLGPLQQGGAQQLLQLLDAGAQGRLADVAGRRRLAEVAAVDHGHQVAKLSQGGDRLHVGAYNRFYRLFNSVFCALNDLRMPLSNRCDQLLKEFQACPSSTPRSSRSRPPPSRTASSSTSPTPTCKGKWSVVFFYPADFTFVCPTELEDLADNYAELQEAGRRDLQRLDRHAFHATRPGTTPRQPSARSSTR